LQPVFANAPWYGNGTSERLFGTGLCLPSGPALTDGDIQRVADTIRNCVAAARQRRKLHFVVLFMQVKKGLIAQPHRAEVPFRRSKTI
jgi:hypothetical protein